MGNFHHFGLSGYSHFPVQSFSAKVERFILRRGEISQYCLICRFKHSLTDVNKLLSTLYKKLAPATFSGSHQTFEHTNYDKLMNDVDDLTFCQIDRPSSLT